MISHYFCSVCSTLHSLPKSKTFEKTQLLKYCLNIVINEITNKLVEKCISSKKACSESTFINFATILATSAMIVGCLNICNYFTTNLVFYNLVMLFGLRQRSNKLLIFQCKVKYNMKSQLTVLISFVFYYSTR